MRKFIEVNKMKKVKEKTCKNPDCKKKFTPNYSSTQVVCSVRCSQELARIKEREKAMKEGKKQLSEMKIETHSKEFRADLQREVNKLSRMIDSHFGLDTCIDCGKKFGKQIDAAHLHSRGSNSSLRWNLHNLHSAKSDCNQYSNKHESGYKNGLSERYGEKYAKYVIEELPLIYKEVKVTNKEVHEKLKLVRSLVKTFGTFDLLNPINARNLFNTLIGIYTNDFKL